MSQPIFVLHTPAKLNLFLEVLGRRSDGFHELETLMTAITLSDTLYFQSRPDGQIRLACDWAMGAKASQANRGDLPDEKSNLVFRAVEALQRRASASAGADVRLVKRIPSAAGMGGASSDAAAALLLANQAWDLQWPLEQLALLAAELGSDVPFFLRGGAGLCRGRGEQIEPVRLPQLWFAVVRPPAGLSTAEVYRHCRPSQAPVGAAGLLAAAASGHPAAIGRHIKNDLQSAAERLLPWAERLSRELTGLAAGPAQMSGSGSSFFVLCRSAAHARQVAARLRLRGETAVWTAASTALRPRGRKISEEGASTWKSLRFASS